MVFFSVSVIGLIFLIMIIFVLSATIDVKRNIFDLCTDTKDCYLAVIEVIVVIQNHLVFLWYSMME